MIRFRIWDGEVPDNLNSAGLFSREPIWAPDVSPRGAWSFRKVVCFLARTVLSDGV